MSGPGRTRWSIASDGPTLFISGGFGSGGLSLSAADLAAFAVGLQQGQFPFRNAARYALGRPAGWPMAAPRH